MQKFTSSYFKALLFVLSLVLVFWAIYSSLFVFIVSLIGIGIGVLLSPLLTILRKKYRVPRALSALACIFLVFAILGSAGYGLWFLIADQVEVLTQRAPQLSENLQSRYRGLLESYPWLRDRLGDVNVSAGAQNVLGQLFSGVRSGFSAAGGLAFAFLLGMYTAVSIDDYFGSVVRAFPAHAREKASSVLSKCATVLRRWFRAQLLDAIIIGLMTALGLWIVGVEYWAIFGLLTAVLGIIPYVGILIVVVCAALLTLASDPAQVPWVLGVFLVTQQIEGNIILPLVMKGAVELPEVPLLIFILLLGSWLGIVGVFLAPALFAMLRVLYIELYLPKVDESIRNHNGLTG